MKLIFDIVFYFDENQKYIFNLNYIVGYTVYGTLTENVLEIFLSLFN